MTSYNPGLHILCTFKAGKERLTDADGCKRLFDNLITGLDLSKVGEVYHPFPGGGFTAVVCLTESHVSIHTWPEFGLATFDVFLSNFYNDNAEKVRSFYRDTLSFFEGSAINVQEVMR